MLTSSSRRRREYLLINDFDQTLSHNDPGVVLSEMLGISDFRQRVAGLSDIHLVQQGGELAYLLLHDPEFRCVRKEHLIEVGKRVRLKANIELLLRSLENLEDFHFRCHVLSSARGSDSVSIGRHRSRKSRSWNAIPLCPGYRRDSVHCSRARRLRQGCGA